MNKMAEEVNELLHDRESLELSELTSLYELPGDFIQQVSFRFFMRKKVQNSILTYNLKDNTTKNGNDYKGRL
jgi:hypothetical protein